MWLAPVVGWTGARLQGIKSKNTECGARRLQLETGCLGLEDEGSALGMMSRR
jgi:hypothetical protein